MDRTVLVGIDLDIDGGRKLFEALKEEGLDVSAALWYYFREPEEWRFVIATPMVDKVGTMEVYTRIQSILKKLDTFPNIHLWNISVVSPKSDLIKHLRSFIKRQPDNKSEHYLSRNTMNGFYIDNAVIYSLNTA